MRSVFSYVSLGCRNSDKVSKTSDNKKANVPILKQKTKEHKVQAASIKAADAFLMKLYMAQLAKEEEAARGE
jgi:hypothetical protein